MARRIKSNGKKDFFLALLVSALVVFVFVAVYLVKNPKNIFKSEAGLDFYVYNCNSVPFEWDLARTLNLDMDDTYSGVLTDHYLSQGFLFDYNLNIGVGLSKVSVNNTLNSGNGYAVTISSNTNPFSNLISPIQSTTESSMVLKFPNPVETASFQMQYGEPFDLFDDDREVPVWGVDIGVYVREVDGTDSLALRQEWNLTPVATTGSLRDICFTIGRNKLISKIIVLVPENANIRSGALPPEKLSLDNFKIQVPKKWTPPSSITATPIPTVTQPTPTVGGPTPTISEDTGTCVCLPNGRVKYDYCNYDYGYSAVCETDGCECVK